MEKKQIKKYKVKLEVGKRIDQKVQSKVKDGKLID